MTLLRELPAAATSLKVCNYSSFIESGPKLMLVAVASSMEVEVDDLLHPGIGPGHIANDCAWSNAGFYSIDLLGIGTMFD